MNNIDTVTVPNTDNEYVREALMSLPGGVRMYLGSLMTQYYRAGIMAALPPSLSEVEKKRRLYEIMYGEPAGDWLK